MQTTIHAYTYISKASVFFIKLIKIFMQTYKVDVIFSLFEIERPIRKGTCVSWIDISNQVAQKKKKTTF